MKNSVIFALMKKRKTLYLTKTHGEQWCCDGSQAYNISSLPELTPDQFLALIGVDTAKQGEYICRIKDELSESIYPEQPCSEKEADTLSFDIDLGAGPLIPLVAFGTVFFIPRKSLKPFADDIADLRYYVRKDREQVSVIIRIGMLQVGVIMPVRISKLAVDDISRLSGLIAVEDDGDA
ncbi:MAG: hypothetical protein IJM87_07195 [Ruminococcus sp.]|nr:hypothetical protein [Ruminococcus sp.]